VKLSSSTRARGVFLPPRDFRGCTVVITGGAGGIGRALARSFGAAGAKIALVDLASSPLSAAREDLESAGIEALALPCDITDAGQVGATMTAVREAFGGIDVLINNAGIVHRSAFAETRPEVFRRVMEVNLFGALHCTQACMADLRDNRGLIIAVSSIAGLAPLYGRSGYAASKHAMHGLFESLGAEVADEGVGVLMVCPSFVESGLEASTLGGDGKRVTRPRSKVGRLRNPDDVAAEVLKAARAGRRRLVLTPVGKTSALLSRIAPGLYERLMIRSLRSELEEP
jgi:NAD(P)-dependent dehydrogenase (short-subunit alcohol dehydrogenase family)